MSKSTDFEVSYDIEDGYVGKSRPQYFKLRKSDFVDIEPASLEEAKNLLYDLVQEDFSQKVTWYLSDEAVEEFVGWFKALKDEDDS